jgi:hypothetical protein
MILPIHCGLCFFHINVYDHRPSRNSCCSSFASPMLVCAGLPDTVGLETGSILPTRKTYRSFSCAGLLSTPIAMWIDRRKPTAEGHQLRRSLFLAGDDSCHGPLSLIVLAFSARAILDVANNATVTIFFQRQQTRAVLAVWGGGPTVNRMLSMDTSDESMLAIPTPSRSMRYSLPAKANMMRHKQRGLLRGKQCQSCGRTRTPSSMTTTSYPVGMSEWW